MKIPRIHHRIIVFSSLITLIAVTATFIVTTDAGAAARDRFGRMHAMLALQQAIHNVLTDEQQAQVEDFREETFQRHTERRAFLGGQRNLLTKFQLSAIQWEALSKVIDLHSDVVLDAVSQVAEDRQTLRKATLSEESDTSVLHGAAATLGLSLGDAAVVINAAYHDVHDVLTPEQQATLNALRENFTAASDENRFSLVERILALRDGLALTGAQKVALTDALRGVLQSLPTESGANVLPPQF